MVEHIRNRDTVQPAHVVGALSALIRAEHRHAAYLGPEMGLGLTEVMALYHLANEPLTAGALRDRVGLSTGSTTALVDRLIQHDLVRRTPHPTDRRAVIVELTPDGHARTFAMLQHFIMDVEKMCADLTASDRAVIVPFLQRLTSVIDDDTTRMQSPSP
jgi:DNA-binding MarR family transcriptional regulator